MGMGLGLFLCAIAGGLMFSQLREHKHLLAETLLQQELRHAMALMRLEVRRSGAELDAHERVPEPGSVPKAVDEAPTLQLLRDGKPVSEGRSGNGLVFSYGRPAPDEASRRVDRGLRLQGAQLQYLLERSWQPWSDSATVRFTRLELSLDTAPSTLPWPCPCAGTSRACEAQLRGQVLRVELLGQSLLDRHVVRSLSTSIRVRNDRLHLPAPPTPPSAPC